MYTMVSQSKIVYRISGIDTVIYTVSLMYVASEHSLCSPLPVLHFSLLVLLYFCFVPTISKPLLSVGKRY